jgi:uncharacterized protein YjiK
MRKPFVLIPLLFILTACHSKTNDPLNDSSKTNSEVNYHYDLSRPSKRWELPDELKEISGNTWIDNNHLLVIEDLHPNLYLLRLGNTAVIEQTIPFQENTTKKFDIEDVTIYNNTVYALWSHGTLFKISNWRNKPQTKEITTFLSKENNTEGLCFDPVTHHLLVACKNESDVADEKKSTRSIYAFDLKGDSLITEPFLLIHKKDFKRNNEKEAIEFFPSAIAVHPVTHDIYILSTRGTKCLARYNHSGQLKDFQLIDKEEMPQPEGMCFSPDGTLFISTEGRHGQPAAIFQFNYHR